MRCAATRNRKLTFVHCYDSSTLTRRWMTIELSSERSDRHTVAFRGHSATVFDPASPLPEYVPPQRVTVCEQTIQGLDNDFTSAVNSTDRRSDDFQMVLSRYRRKVGRWPPHHGAH